MIEPRKNSAGSADSQEYAPRFLEEIEHFRITREWVATHRRPIEQVADMPRNQRISALEREKMREATAARRRNALRLVVGGKAKV